MTIDQSTRLFYAKEFIRDFRDATKRHKSFPEDFDRFLLSLRNGNVIDVRILNNMPSNCIGFSVSKVRTFRCADLKRSPKHGYRIIFSECGDAVLFLECYYKSQKETENRARICRSLSNVRNHECAGHYIEQDVPGSRFLLQNIRW